MFDLDHVDGAVRPIAGDDQVLALHNASFAVGFQLGGPAFAVFRLVEQAKVFPVEDDAWAILVVDLEVAFDGDAIDDEGRFIFDGDAMCSEKKEDEGLGFGGDVGGDALDGDEVMVDLGVGFGLSMIPGLLPSNLFLLAKEFIGGVLGEKLLNVEAEMAESFGGAEKDGAKELELGFEVASGLEGLTSGVEVLEFDVSLNLFAIFPELAVEVGVRAAVFFNEMTARGVGESVGEGVDVAGEEKIGIEEDGSDVERIDVRDHRQDSFKEEWDIIIAQKREESKRFCGDGGEGKREEKPECRREK